MIVAIKSQKLLFNYFGFKEELLFYKTFEEAIQI